MKLIELSTPRLGFVIGTRVALAAGIGLLVALMIPNARRRAIGVALVVMGAVTTIPAALLIFGHRARSAGRRRRLATVNDGDLDDWCALIKGEYLELPGLSLTAAQNSTAVGTRRADD